jgi:two-component system NtrC family response regulator
MDKILIVDDEPSILSQLKWGLSDDYQVLTAAGVDEARRLLRDEKPGVVTLDVALGTREVDREAGLGLLDEIVDHYPLIKVIMVTGNDSRENALASIQRGAVDWYSKPIQLEELKTILARAFHIQRLEAGQGAVTGRKRYHRLVGESESLKRVFGLIQRVAPPTPPC